MGWKKEPEFEGRGIGRALHDAMLAWLRSCGLPAVTLGTDPGTRAAGFYETAGWKFREIDGSGEAGYEVTLTWLERPPYKALQTDHE